jgi:hypothetical protein
VRWKAGVPALVALVRAGEPVAEERHPWISAEEQHPESHAKRSPSSEAGSSNRSALACSGGGWAPAAGAPRIPRLHAGEGRGRAGEWGRGGRGRDGGRMEWFEGLPAHAAGGAGETGGGSSPDWRTSEAIGSAAQALGTPAPSLTGAMKRAAWTRSCLRVAQRATDLSLKGAKPTRQSVLGDRRGWHDALDV